MVVLHRGSSKCLGHLARLLSDWTGVGSENEFLGFISDGDVIRALERGVDLQGATAQEIMNSAFIGVAEDATLTSVARMFDMGFSILPVVKDGKVTCSVTRHDYLRARLGIGPGLDE